MANFNDIKHEIDQNVNTNGVQAITGAILNETLKDMIDEVDEKKQDTLVAGQNITIQGNVISATGGGSGEEYYAGHGIDIDSNNVISADFNFVQEKLVDGQNIKSVNGEPILGSGDIDIPEYVEGNGIDITNLGYVNEISVDPSDLAGNGLFVDAQGNLAVNPSDIVGTGLATEGDARIAVDPSVVQGKLTAGANIQISGNTISATNTTYSAGSGLNLNGTTFSADTTVLATKSDLQGKQDTLQAGNGLEIDQNNEISVKAGSGLGFDSNGYLINTGGGGGGQTLVAGDGIEIDSNDAINAKLGNGLQLDSNNNIEIDTSVVASQSDLSSYLRNDASGQIQNFLDGTGDTELKIVDGYDEDYVKLGAYETPGEAPHIEIYENGSGDTKFFYDHIERGSQVSIDYPTSSGTLALTSDIPSPGAGLQVSAGNEIYVDTTQIQEKLTAGANIQINGSTISATDTDTTYSAGSGLNLNGTTFSVDTTTIQEKLTAGTGISINGTTISATGGSGATYTAGNGINIDQNNEISVDNNYLDGEYLSLNGGVLRDTTGQPGTVLNIQSPLGGGGGNIIYNVSSNNGASITIGSSGYDSTTIQNDYISVYNATSGKQLEISSEGLGDGSTYHASLPTLTQNETLAVVSDLAGKQDTLTAGSGISIQNNVISATGGGGGTSFTPGDALELDQNDNLNVLYGSGLIVNGNNELEVDTSIITGFLSVEGGTLQADPLIPASDTVLDIVGPQGVSSISLDSGDNADPNDPQGTATITMSDSNGYVQIKPNGVSDGTYTASWPSLSGDDTIATLSDIPTSLWEEGSGSGSIKNVEAASANGDHAFVAGYNAHADGNYSVALGARANASYANAYAIGADAAASQSHAFAIGKDANSSASYAYAIGRDASSSASYAAAIGRGVQATNQNEVGLGVYNKSTTGSTSDDNSKFTIGNGTGNAARSNVLEIKENGDAYLYGVGGFTGANTSAATTLQDVINNGGGGSSYSAGSGIDITNNTISVDNTIATVSDLQGYLPLQGGTLQDDSAGATDTSLGIMSPGDGDVSITMQVLQDEANSQFRIENNAVHEILGTGSGESISDFSVDNNGESGLFATVASNFVDDDGDWVRDDFESSITFYAPAGQGIPAEVNINAYSSNLSDPGNETSEANISISDDRGQIEFNPTGFSDGTYTLSFPSLSQDETIATLSDIQSGGSYLPLTGGTLQEDPNDSTSTELLIQSPETYATADLTTVDLDPGNTAESLAKLTLSDYDSSNNPHTAIYGTTGITNVDGYKISFPTLTGDDTFALLSDVQGGGGATYTAGTGISISAQNVISNTAPDPGLWAAGNGTNSIRTFTASSGAAGGINSIIIGDNTQADGGYSMAIGSGSKVYGSNLYATAIAGGQVGTFGSNGYQYAVAIGNGAYCTAANTIALGVGARSFNQGEISIGYYANAITNGTTAENTRFTVGNGTSGSARSNLIEAKQNNDLYIYGVGGFTGTNASSASTLQTVLSGKQDTLTAGSGISIVNNVISATGGGGGGSSLWTNGTGTDSLVAPATVNSSLSLDPAAGDGAISCGYDTNADGDFAFAQGAQSTASGDYSFSANNSTASGNYSAAFGAAGANGMNSFAAVSGSADADYSVALAGGQVRVDDSDPDNPIDAQYGVAIGEASVVEGEYGLAMAGGTASGSHSVAIGDSSSASEMYSTAFAGSNAQGNYSFAASTGAAAGHYSSAFGGGTANGEGSLASGFATSAYGFCSAALGYSLSTYDQADGTTSLDPNAGEVALGRYNYSETDIIFTVGCGYLDETDPDNPEEVRENAVAITNDGKIYLKGLGGYTGTSISGCTDLVSFLNNL